MDPLRKLLVLVIIGIVFASAVIGVLFFIINKCLFRRGRHRISQLQTEMSFKSQSNKYYIKDSEAAVPPLPPRTQFLTAEAQSYENLAEADYEQSIHDYQQDVHNYEQDVHDSKQSIHDYEEAADQQPDYVAVEDETFPPLLPCNHSDPNMILAQSYENLAEEGDYLQALDEQPDYVRADDEANVFLPPLPPAADDSASEDYDDIGEEAQGEEDYDDVA